MMTDSDPMPFGKFRGEKMANVPPSYLKWLWENHIVSVQSWNKVYWYISDNLDAIESELKSNGK